jgi:PAS domain S-box-containing protein
MLASVEGDCRVVTLSYESRSVENGPIPRHRIQIAGAFHASAELEMAQQRIPDRKGRPLTDLGAEPVFRALLDLWPAASYTCDPTGEITYYNRTAVRFWGREPRLNDPGDRFCGSHHLFAPDDIALARENCWTAKAIQTGLQQTDWEAIIERPDGSRINVLAHAYPIFGEAGKLAGVASMLLDITDRKQTVGSIKQNDSFVRAVLDSLRDHIAVLDRDGNILAVNDAWEAFAAQNAGDATTRLGVGVNYLEVCRSVIGEETEDARVTLVGIEEVLRGKSPQFTYEYPCHSPTEKRWFFLNVTPLFRNQGGAVMSHVNITERRLAHEARVRLIEQLLTAQEDERRRVALDLHDDIGQALTALLLGLAAAQESPSLDQWRACVARLRDRVAEVLDSVRRLARGLRPSALDDLGLGAAVQRYVADFTEAHRIPVQLVLPKPGTQRWPGRVEIALYRIIQEALTNVAKHARARHVRVALTEDASQACLSVQDDGPGIAAADWEKQIDHSKHLGLSGIRERASLLGGSVELRSSPGQGTRLIVTIPLEGRTS